MSTRATYHFKPDGEYAHLEPTTTIYIHYDGYPEGAAMYFYALLIHPSKGDAATQFIRANGQAELTLSHEVHGDTVYRYTLIGHGPQATLLAQKAMFENEHDFGPWRKIFGGPVCEFIDQHTEMIEDYTPFRKVHRNYGYGQWLNLDTARLQLEAEYGVLRTLRVWSANGNNDRGANWRDKVESLGHIVEVFPELRTDEVDGFLATVETDV